MRIVYNYETILYKLFINLNRFAKNFEAFNSMGDNLNTDITIQEPENNEGGGYLKLPFSEAHFKDFVTNLLGTPQTITKKIRGDFEIDLNEVMNFHHLIDQRITQQNNARLIQLQTQIYFSDESSVILSSFEELRTYNEIKPIVSEAVKMTWSYLVQFQDRKTPEKQTIELTVVSSFIVDEMEDEFSPVYHFTQQGQFRIVIKHTARTWASDIESLLTHQINSLIIKESPWKKFVRKHRVVIANVSAFLFLLMAIIAVYIANIRFIEAESAKALDFLSSSVTTENKIDYVINYIIANSQNLLFLKSIIYTLISVIISVFIITWVSALANIKSKSHLLLTKATKTELEKSNKKIKKKIILFFVSMILNIVLSLISSFIFLHLVSV